MFADMSNKPIKSYMKYIYMRKCVVCGLRKSDNVIMHKVPKNQVIKDKWSKAAKKELSGSAMICSNHFQLSDYKKCNAKKILVHGAIPTVNLNSVDVSETEDQTFSEGSQRLSNYDTFNLSDKQNVDSDSEDLSSSQAYENTNSEKEISYIYYLDEKQNVRFYARHDNVESDSSA